MQLTISPDFVSSGGVVCKRNTKKVYSSKISANYVQTKIRFPCIHANIYQPRRGFFSKAWVMLRNIYLRKSETHLSNLLGWRNYAQTSRKTGGHQKMSLYFTHLFCNMRYFWLCQPGVNKEKLSDLFSISKRCASKFQILRRSNTYWKKGRIGKVN